MNRRTLSQPSGLAGIAVAVVALALIACDRGGSSEMETPKRQDEAHQSAEEDLLRHAEDLIASEQPLAAAILLAPVSTDEKASPELRNLYGKALALSHDWSRALEFLGDSEDECIAAAMLGAGNASGSLDRLQTALGQSRREEILCLLGKVAWIAGEQDCAIEFWTRARDQGADPVLLKFSALSANARDIELVRQLNIPPLSDSQAREYRAARLISYLAYYGVVLPATPPSTSLENALTGVGATSGVFADPLLARLLESASALASMGDASVFAAVGDAFVIKGDTVAAARFYHQATMRRRRMVGLLDAAWAEFRLGRIAGGEGAETQPGGPG